MPTAQTTFNHLTGQTLGHYQILRETGRGGMSMVYEAEDTRIGRRVALKVLSVPLSLAPEQGAAMIARLKREARAIARLSHPNIVTIFDIGEDDGQHFIVMEFLEGLTLRERIAEGALPLGEVASVLDGVAAGLDAVHAAGIVHRDIKPSNVMLLPNGAIKLMDFGVARQHEDTMVTQVGSIVGSPTYMAPEQTEGAESSTATDLWSLGVTLYEMLAGKPPFVGENIPRILYQVAHERPPALPDLTPAVRDVLNRALEKRPERRFQSARQLADAFRAALPAPVRPAVLNPAPRVAAVPRPAQARLASSRRRPVLWAAGLLLLALLAALPGVLRSRHAPVPMRQAGLSGAAPATKVRPAHTRPIGIARSAPSITPGIAPRPAVTRQPAPAVRVAARQRARAFRHPRRAPRRVAAVAAPREIIPVAMAHPRPPRRAARAARAQHTAPASPVHTAQRAADVPPVRSARHTRPRRVMLTPPPTPAHAGSERSDTARAASPAPSPGAAGPRLTGTWHGTLTNHRATLHIDRHEGDEFAGTMTVHTGGHDARVAVTGHVSRAGRISMRETHRLPGTASDSWDLGTEAGRVGGDGRISGTGTDVRGRSGGWSFSR